jgi:hypothetical protein
LRYRAELTGTAPPPVDVIVMVGSPPAQYSISNKLAEHVIETRDGSPPREGRASSTTLLRPGSEPEAPAGEYELVRRVLAHKSVTTTMKFYLELETTQASEICGRNPQCRIGKSRNLLRTPRCGWSNPWRRPGY